MANDLSRILNDKNKTIRELNRKLLIQYKKPIIFEIERKLDHRDEHVAFVTNEELAWEFCDKHKDCYYHEIHITKYRNELEAQRGEVPCCGSCDYISPQVKSDGSSITWCNHHQQETNQDEYCSDWEDAILNGNTLKKEEQTITLKRKDTGQLIIMEYTPH